MPFIDRMMAALGYTPRGRDPHDGRFWGDVGVTALSGVSVTRETALQNGVIQAVLEVLAGTCSTLPLKVYSRAADGSGEDREHPLTQVLHRRLPNGMTAVEFRDEQFRHLAFERNAYARLIYGSDGALAGFDPIHPSRVINVERREGRVYYTIAPIGVGSVEVLRDDQIWHIRKAPLTVDGLRGRPYYETGREEIGRAMAVEAYGALWFRNSGKSGGVLKHPGAFKSAEDRQMFLDAWRDGSTGANAHKDRLLTHGVEYQPLSVANDEAQFIETLKQCEVKIARLWQMPPHRVGILDRATNNNIEHQGLDFVIYSLAPWIAAFEQSVSAELLPEADQATHKVEFNVAGLLRGDIKARYQAYALGRQWGWLTVNDILRLENMPLIGAAGDVHLTPMNMSPAGDKPEPDADR